MNYLRTGPAIRNSINAIVRAAMKPDADLDESSLFNIADALRRAAEEITTEARRRVQARPGLQHRDGEF